MSLGVFDNDLGGLFKEFEPNIASVGGEGIWATGAKGGELISEGSEGFDLGVGVERFDLDGSL